MTTSSRCFAVPCWPCLAHRASSVATCKLRSSPCSTSRQTASRYVLSGELISPATLTFGMSGSEQTLQDVVACFCAVVHSQTQDYATMIRVFRATLGECIVRDPDEGSL